MKKKFHRFITIIFILVLFLSFINTIFLNNRCCIVNKICAQKNFNSLTVKINIDPYSVIYEGDIINCSISGESNLLYWQIDDNNPHYTFYGNDPILFDPEPTPLGKDYVNLTVYAKNDVEFSCDTVIVMIKRLFFGDIHWHSVTCDGRYKLEKMYKNAKNDNYLDFAAYSGHAEWIDGLFDNDLSNPDRKLNKTLWNLVYLNWFIKNYIQLKILKINEWDKIKKICNKYYDEGNFSTFLGFEWTATEDNNFHTNFYYRDVYPDALEYSCLNSDPNGKPNIDAIFQAMVDEWDKGHYNIGFPHHPQYVKVNWTYFANDVNESNRNKILRGVEVYSLHGTAVGQKYTPNLPYNWPYSFRLTDNGYSNNSWVENAMWEWSKNERKGQRFVLMASSDIHHQSRPGSAISEAIMYNPIYNPAGIIAAYAVHNNRSEIWDAINSCDVYASQLLKIRVNVRFDGKIAYGRWINCSSPLKIQITAQSTFPGLDRSGKSMCPHGYSKNELDYPIQDIWLIKKDNETGQPWCKIIGHATPNKDTAIVFFNDSDVQPNDFYWIAIRQKGDYLRPRIIKNPFLPKPDDGLIRDEYMAFLGPVFIDSVI